MAVVGPDDFHSTARLCSSCRPRVAPSGAAGVVLFPRAGACVCRCAARRVCRSPPVLLPFNDRFYHRSQIAFKGNQLRSVSLETNNTKKNEPTT